MNINLVWVLALAIGTSALNAKAENACPDTVNYTTGSSLKSGSTYYYPTGSYLMANDGDTIYYPTGSYLKAQSAFYFPTGSYLTPDGQTIYYPSGSYLETGGDYYYQNGSYLKSGESFYYSNGSYARSGGTLYDQTGAVTQFPVQITESLGGNGNVLAKVNSTSENVFVIAQLIQATDQVSLTAVWKNAVLDHVTSFIETGTPNQAVKVTMTPSGVTCSLESH